MKLTDDQINQIFGTAERLRRAVQNGIDSSAVTGPETGNDSPARRVMVESIIEGYQALEPAPAVRWIPAANRKPAPEDFSTSGQIIILRDNMMAQIHCSSEELSGTHYHWISSHAVKSLPKEPFSPEAVEENEFGTWWNENFEYPISSDTKNIARAAWKAARNK